MRTGWKWTMIALLGAGLFGCRSDGRLFPPAGSVQKQRFNATVFDPYADNETGPEVVGGRPERLSETPLRVRQESPVPEGLVATLTAIAVAAWSVSATRVVLCSRHGCSHAVPGLSAAQPLSYDCIVSVRPFRGIGTEPLDDSDATPRQLYMSGSANVSQAAAPRPMSKSVSSFESTGSGQRLQKVLAAAGIASRRECEALILDGRVEVNRETVTELGTRVDPSRQEIRVDGVPLAQPHHVYYLVNKPAGVVSTNRDPDRRTRVIDLVPGDTRLFTIGRLDRSSEGLIIVTNDGELANLLTHPRYGIPKTYRATVLGFPTPETLQKLRTGVHLAEGVAQVAELRAKGRHARGAELEIVLTEGRNREIRRVLARVGHKVLHLRRVAIGPLRLGNLAAGEARRLTGAEVQQLRACVRQMMKPGGMRPRANCREEAKVGQRQMPGGLHGPRGALSRADSPVARKTGGSRNRQERAAPAGAAGFAEDGDQATQNRSGVGLRSSAVSRCQTAPPEKHPSREETTTLMSNPLHAAHYADSAIHTQVAIDENVRVARIRSASACAVTKSPGTCFPASS